MSLLKKENVKNKYIKTCNQIKYESHGYSRTDVANIYGSIAGAMPGSPTQKFTPNPVVQGIGGFANMYRTTTPPPGTQQV